MRIAAGVLLIIAALFNGCAGALYMGGGAAATVAGQAGEDLAKLDGGITFTDDAGQASTIDVTDKAKLQKDSGEVKKKGAGLMAFGLFVFALLVLQIAAAVLLFVQKKPTFIMVIGVMGILAEIGGILIVKFGVTNVPGLLGSLMALYAANQLKKAGTPGTA